MSVRLPSGYAPKPLDAEIGFLVDVFSDNGHARSMLEDIAKNYVVPEKTNPTTTYSANNNTINSVKNYSYYTEQRSCQSALDSTARI